jgi:hypothetical protein
MRWEIARALPPPRTVLCDRHRESHRGRRTCAAPALTIRGQAEGRAVVLARVIAAPHGVAPRLERVACYVDELRNTAVHAIPDDRAEQRSDGRQAIHCRRASRGSEGPLGGSHRARCVPPVRARQDQPPPAYPRAGPPRAGGRNGQPPVTGVRKGCQPGGQTGFHEVQGSRAALPVTKTRNGTLMRAGSHGALAGPTLQHPTVLAEEVGGTDGPAPRGITPNPTAPFRGRSSVPQAGPASCWSQRRCS